MDPNADLEQRMKPACYRGAADIQRIRIESAQG